MTEGEETKGQRKQQQQQQQQQKQSKEKEPHQRSNILSYLLTREARVGLIFLAFSCSMLVFPLGMFFMLKSLAHSTTVCALGALVAVQVIIAGFIYCAWLDEKEHHE